MKTNMLKLVCTALISCLVGVFGANAQAQLDLVVGKSTTLTAPFNVTSVRVGDPDIASVEARSATEFRVRARKIGRTTVKLTAKNGREHIVDVSVNVSTDEIQAVCDQITGAGRVRVGSTGFSIILEGSLKSASAVSDVLDGIKARYVGKENPPHIINRLRVDGKQQVQVKLKFVEVSRTGLRALGFDALGDQRVYNTAGQIRNQNTLGILNAGTSRTVTEDTGLYTGPNPARFGFPATTPLATQGLITSPALGAFRLVLGDSRIFPFISVLSVLSSKGLAKTLSEPVVVAQSGQRADFLVGGQFPVPVPAGLGTISIEWKDYGIALGVVPTILDDGDINVEVKANVSDLDFSSGISLQNVQVPGLTSRSADTTVRMKDGQSFAVAGLVSDRMQNSVRKVPLLGDIPVLGMLFRSQDASREEIELVMIVSVELVGPQNSAALPKLPIEEMHNDPNDVEFFLFGWGDARKEMRKDEVLPEPASDEEPVARAPANGRGAAVPLGPVGFER